MYIFIIVKWDSPWYDHSRPCWNF